MSYPRRRSGDVINAVGEMFTEYSTSYNSPAGKGRTDATAMNRVNSKHNSNELARIYNLWQQAKKELQIKSREIASLKANSGRTTVEARLSRINAQENEELLRETSALREKLKLVVTQLEDARAENDRWSTSYDTLSSELEIVREMQESARHSQASVDGRVRELEEQVAGLSEENKRLRSGKLEEIREYEDGARRNKMQLADYEQKVRDMTQAIEEAHHRRDEAESLVYRMREDLDSKNKQLEMTTTQLQTQSEHLQNEARLTTSFQFRELQARIDHLRVDNARLLTLLKSTEEYKSFCDYCIDAGESEGVTYFTPASAEVPAAHILHNSKPRNRLGIDSLSSSCHEKCKSPHRGSSKKQHQWAQSRSELRSLQNQYGNEIRGDSKPTKTSSVFEHEHWIPTEAVRIGAGFRNRYLPNVSLDLIGSFLRDLNVVWQKRENRVTKKIKQKHEKQLAELRRRIHQSASYEEVMQKKKIDRLKKSVYTLRSQHQPSPPRLQQEISDTTSLATCLAEINELSYNLKQANNEIDNLRGQLAERGPTKTGIRVENLNSDVNAIVNKIKIRMRDCMNKVSKITAHQDDPDYSNLLIRAYSAMMEDVEGFVEELLFAFRHYLPATP
eukprot:CAMPEP_0203752588 /NCGR_PEP_ID=MMETSP0098-20131031/6486_1 /ASSEMBLY_ACC=CAM_ASM_000208 /TAXON_ID=96639 /ORGANISM=" , Strain NY0313808BC1" /LENGTH=617 /DNA_ID=CAMNT_0050642817 /DNA_START=142 /DNA_END=1992 /DNA_ORIENTATION=-